MTLVNLVSGGIDSTLVSMLAQEAGIRIFPLFVDYGQKAGHNEWTACESVHRRLQLPAPVKINLKGFGAVIRSGLTDSDLDVKTAAFTPGRNLLFLLLGGAYAYQMGAQAVSLGLLSENLGLFPDQRESFIETAEKAIQSALGSKIQVVTPLSELSKADVLELAREKGITGTYSCHMGTDTPCGYCISCLEISNQLSMQR